jgi:hypothetical protein
VTRHPLTVIGAWLVTVTAFVFIFVFFVDLFGLDQNPYFGLIFFVVLPVFFVIGLLMVPAGWLLERRRRTKGLAPRRWPRIDLNQPRYQRGAAVIGALTIVNLLIVSLAAYRGVEYMDSTAFCGQVCHTVMEPEYVAHRDGPHSRVSCVECHVGSGAESYMYYKINGARQLIDLVRDTYPRPIPTPVLNLRPARSTCEQCHWPAKFHGDKVEVIPAFGNDEHNTPAPTTLVLHIGGGMPRFGLGLGIHWHTNTQTEVDYIATDAKRQVIPFVRVKGADGKVVEYRTPDVTDAQLAAGESRRMDCIDCHNRPTHAFAVTPERAVDAAIFTGAISQSMPFARREAVAALKGTYADRAAAGAGIAERLRAFYTAHPAAKAEVDRLVDATQFLYTHNVFPAMKVTWGTHPNNLGHTDSPGCFRCHDDQHKSTDGRVIRQDCDLCHDIK